MRAPNLLTLLYASVVGILVILAIILGYTLSQEEEFLHPVTETSSAIGADVAETSAAFKAGRKIWQTQGCGSCHSKTMKNDVIGPALGGVTQRWSAYPREDLYAWVRSSQKLIAEKHPRALELWKKWDPSVMANYDLTDEEIESLLSFIEEQYAKP
ncbi:MAG: c-type cytochrome [Bacteroidota bacterium]